MALTIGIIGLPNVGKSTLFTALTKKRAEIQNYAFTTIEPNVGIVNVPDVRLTELARVSQSVKIVPATATFVDIAGLVKNAHKGEGLGNKFLSNIREVNAIVHVIRDFENKDITHVHGKIDPREDYDVITTELLFADLATIEKRIQAVEGKARSGDKQSNRELVVYRTLQEQLSKGTVARDISLPDEDAPLVKELQLLTAKPELKVYNVDEKDVAKDLPGGIVISAKIEAELADLSEEEAKEMLEALNIKEPGLNRLIRESYQLLNLITYFTSGPKETRGWAISRGMNAQQAAGEIHSDFEAGFIKAEVTFWKDFVDCRGEANAKAKGRMHLEGKEYIVQDGDVMFFHTRA